MSLTNPNSLVTEQNLSDFYEAIYPYLGSGGTMTPVTLTNPNHIVTEERLSEFYQGISPYLGSYKTPQKPATVYGIRILRDESVPSSKIEYLADAIGMTPAHMDYENDIFDYGSWGDAFFMPKPCMLKYDGTVDYYLDPNDYSKKEDGTASDIADTTYGGNAMMEWPKIWLKIVPDATKDNKEADIFISNEKVDENYTDWNYHNSLGESVDHFYTAIYNVALVGSTIRSISGTKAIRDKNATYEKTAAEANNPSGSSVIWTNGTCADRDLIQYLLMLIGKSTNLKAVFGSGLTTTDRGMYENIVSGSQNAKGLFYGTQSGTWSSSNYSNVVKVFGMENYWGTHDKRYVGEIMINNVRKRKLTYGTEDGSTSTGYNLTGEGYIQEDNSGISGSDGSYIKEMMFTQTGMYPVTVSSDASSSTYFCEQLYYYTNGNTRIPMAFGSFKNGLRWPATWTYYTISSTLSARPLS